MTLFTKFDFRNHGLDKKEEKNLKKDRDEKEYFYKRRNAEEINGIILDFYVPRTREISKQVSFDVIGEEEEFTVLQVNEEETKKLGSVSPTPMADGSAFLEAELVSQPCVVKDNKVLIYREDLKSLCNISNQPLTENSKWAVSIGDRTTCPYCYGYYYINPATPTHNKCPYCYLTEAEAKKEAAKWGFGGGRGW